VLSPKLTGKKSKLESEKSKSIKTDSPESEKEFNFDLGVKFQFDEDLAPEPIAPKMQGY
jgi:hypothetical protein